MEYLSELERDALGELANIGVGRAAANLARMVGEQVHLSVPAVEVVTRETGTRLLASREPSDLVAIRQDFNGSFGGRALLIFPEANSFELVRAVLGGGVDAADIADLEQEALAEIGNVILNGCMATIANLLKRPMTMSLPSVLRGRVTEIFGTAGGTADEEVVLFFYIDFDLRRRNIRGYLALIMNLPSVTALRLLVHDFVRRAQGGAEP